MTVLLVERLLVDSQRRDAFAASVESLLSAMRDAGGFLWADASSSWTDAELVLLVSEWRTTNALERFCDGDAYASFRADTDVCLREDVSSRRFDGT